MEELMTVITLWLTVTFGLPQAPDHPKIRHLEPRHLAAMHYGRASLGDSEDVVAVYDNFTRTIVLRPDWDGGSIADVSVLVHELVHHLQNDAGLSYACPQEREALAYKAQERWLQLFGEDLESAFGIDALSLKFKTACLPY